MYLASPEDERDFYIKAYLKAAISNPVHIVARVYKQILSLLRRPLSTDYREISGDCSQIMSFENVKPLFAAWAARCDRFIGGTNYRSISLINIIFYNLAFMPLLITAILVFVYEGAIKRRPGMDRRQSLERQNLICFTGIFLLINLLISLVHTLDVFRYYVMQAPLIFVLFLSTIIYICTFARKHLDRSMSA
jgi:hypothetical protein